jgi:hypothetical protein
VHTLLHASWVNQIETWFSILQRRVLKHGSFASAAALTPRVLGSVGQPKRVVPAPDAAGQRALRTRRRSDLSCPRAASRHQRVAIGDRHSHRGAGSRLLTVARYSLSSNGSLRCTPGFSLPENEPGTNLGRGPPQEVT